jgi:hypothetical protein
VLESTSDDVDVIELTDPSAPVVTMTVETRRVDDATSAEVMVVFDVFSFELDDFSLLPDDPGADVDVADVMTVLDVVSEVIVVGVLFDVVVDVCVLVVALVVVLLSSELLADAEAVADAEAPVPKSCLL